MNRNQRAVHFLFDEWVTGISTDGLFQNICLVQRRLVLSRLSPYFVFKGVYFSVNIYFICRFFEQIVNEVKI